MSTNTEYSGLICLIFLSKPLNYALILLLLQKLKVTYVGVELVDLKSGDLRWCLDFRDMDSPAIILLTDAYGKRSESGGFVLCPLYGRKSKAFQAASGTTNSAIISSLVRMEFLVLNILFPNNHMIWSFTANLLKLSSWI